MSRDSDNTNRCFLCGSSTKYSRPYLTTADGSIIRNCAYFLTPLWILQKLSVVSNKFNSIVFNRKFFGDKKLLWCDSCCMAFVLPMFNEADLDSYYREFYWQAREEHEIFFNKDSRIPLESKIKSVEDQFDWVSLQGVRFSTAIDFGAGDCAGAYVLAKKCGLNNVSVVDSANQTKLIADSMGINYSPSLQDVKPVDFLYSSHTIEHVADLLAVFDRLAKAVCEGGYIFLETPNIADKDIFYGLVFTPHTYSLSETSFRKICEARTLKVVAVHTTGPEWRQNHSKIDSQAR